MYPFILGRRAFLAAFVPGHELRCDVAVVGAGVGGCAAALAALRNGMSVVMTEATDWIGGQLTSQAVPPDEHPWIEQFGCTRAYREYREGVRQFYRDHYPLTDSARRERYLNPGNGTVSKLTHEPRVSLAVLENALASYLSNGKLTLLLNATTTAADVDGDRVRSVTVGEKRVTASYFLDATELGDLLPLTRTEYTRDPNQQAFTYCFAMDNREGEDHTIDKPTEYFFWRDYVPKLNPSWPGKLLSWTYSQPITLKPFSMSFEQFWRYRRIVDRSNFQAGAYQSDITLVNWPQNDYWSGSLIDVTPAEAERHRNRAKQLSLSWLYWMQTDQGHKGLRLRRDIVGTEDGLAKAPYVRESRRMDAELSITPETLGQSFPDSVGVGSYRIDLHPSTGGDNYVDRANPPFEIPLGALLPKRVENLIAAAKNIGTTHLTNGCYRLHPVEWNIGEAAGCLAAEAVRTGNSPRAIRNTPKLLSEFVKRIQAQGMETKWPQLRPL